MQVEIDIGGKVESTKEVKMVNLKSLAKMTDEEIDKYALEIWKIFTEIESKQTK